MVVTPIVRRRGSGFTLVELVIFLALTGLVMLIIFLALPAANRERRNTKRKGDLLKISDNLDKLKDSTVLDLHYPQGVSNMALPCGGVADFNCLFDKTQAGASLNYALNDDTDPLSKTSYTYAVCKETDPSCIIPPPPTATTAATVLYEFNRICANPAAQPSNQSELYSLTMTLEGGGTYCIDNH